MGGFIVNILGALLIMLGCTAAGIIKARSLSESDKTYAALIAALMLIKSEVSSRSAPLDEVMRTVQSAAAGNVKQFVMYIGDSFPKLGEKTFCQIWEEAAESFLKSISPRALSSVKTLGASLGRYDSDMQCAALCRCIEELSAEQRSLMETLCANKRMYVGVGGAAGLIIAIALI